MEDNMQQQALPLDATEQPKRRSPRWNLLPSGVRRAVRELLVAHTVHGMIKWESLFREASMMDAVNGFTPGQLRMMVYKCRDQRHPGIVKPFVCPECRAAGSIRRFPNKQGMGMHRNKAHSVSGVRIERAMRAYAKPAPEPNFAAPKAAPAERLPEREVAAVTTSIHAEAARAFVAAKNHLALPTREASFCWNCGENLKALRAVSDVRFCPACGERLVA